MLSTLRLAGETVAFQRQSPGTGLPRHVDPCSWVLACHLGISCPTGGEGAPYISVAGEKYHWQDGRVMLFDPSFKCAPQPLAARAAKHGADGGRGETRRPRA